MEQCLYPKIKDKKKEKNKALSDSTILRKKPILMLKLRYKSAQRVEGDLRSVLDTAVAFLPYGVKNI